MGILDVLLAKPIALDQAEEELGRPDKAEEGNLTLHVERCAKRWALSYRASKQNSAQLNQIRAFLIFAVIIALIYSPPLQHLASAVAAVMGLQ